MKKIRVLVVEDSLTVRKRICEILAADPAIDIVGEAEDGKRGIELCQSLRPDVVTLDMMLPIMSGLAATEYIMAHCPTPILIVSSSVNRGELFKTYEALAAGATEVMDKPQADSIEEDWERRFITMVKLVSRVKVITHLRGRLGTSQCPKLRQTMPIASDTVPSSSQNTARIVALGVSTGGPSALVDILRALPQNFPLPILIVIHIGEPFGHAFAEWLDGQTPHPVRMAKHGMSIERGIYLAPPEQHLVVRNGCMLLTNDPPRHSCRPSVDVLFESLVVEYGAATIACLLTGMGQDGARGLLAIRQAGGLTIAQDEASCVVYGMPREAAVLGAAQRILPLADIGPALIALTDNCRISSLHK